MESTGDNIDPCLIKILPSVRLKGYWWAAHPTLISTFLIVSRSHVGCVRNAPTTLLSSIAVRIKVRTLLKTEVYV